MPKVSIYVPDELYRAARDNNLSSTSLTQDALRAALLSGRTRAWTTRVRARPPRVSATREVDTRTLMDGVRDEFGR